VPEAEAVGDERSDIDAVHRSARNRAPTFRRTAAESEARLRLDLEYARSWASESGLELVVHRHSHLNDAEIPSERDMQASHRALPCERARLLTGLGGLTQRPPSCELEA
jgi:hypothetical protein